MERKVFVLAGSATLTLAISPSLKGELRELNWVNWSEETRRFLEERVRKLKLLKKLDTMTKDSRLTEEDIMEIGAKINKGIAKRHGIKV
ncbi:Uncharacterised protein [uncultured archaeon]|nr:Uncharacterised protein [uncultured archaeon]